MRHLSQQWKMYCRYTADPITKRNRLSVWMKSQSSSLPISGKDFAPGKTVCSMRITSISATASPASFCLLRHWCFLQAFFGERGVRTKSWTKLGAITTDKLEVFKIAFQKKLIVEQTLSICQLHQFRITATMVTNIISLKSRKRRATGK